MYYPPDYDPRKGGLNKWQGTHALRERARKLHLGILIIRFEMPYNIWCEGCGNHIGMGVRYNAQKTKVGMYYTTPVYQFRMKCHLCDNHFEIKTDPGNLDYEIVSGARRQEKRFKAEDNGTVVPDEKDKIHKLASDEMFKLEHGDTDKGKGEASRPVIKKIYEIQDRSRDDYEANKALRSAMRVKRKAAKAQADLDGKLLKKSSLNISLLPENEADKTTAALLRMAPALTPEQRQRNERGEIMEKQTIFDQSGTSGVAATPSSSLSACTSVSSPLSKAATAKAERVKQFQKLVSVRKRQSADASGFASFSASVKVGRRKSDGLPSSTAGSSATIVSVSTNETKKLDVSLPKTANSSEEQNSKSSNEVKVVANLNDAGKSQTSFNEAAKELSSSNALSSLVGDYDSSESE